MPFVNMKQNAACWAEKKRNPKSTWDCHEWAEHTDYSKLPKGPSSEAKKAADVISAFFKGAGALEAAIAVRNPQLTPTQRLSIVGRCYAVAA